MGHGTFHVQMQIVDPTWKPPKPGEATTPPRTILRNYEVTLHGRSKVYYRQHGSLRRVTDQREVMRVLTQLEERWQQEKERRDALKPDAGPIKREKAIDGSQIVLPDAAGSSTPSESVSAVPDSGADLDPPG